MIVVLDFNTLVSGFRGIGDTPPVQLIQFWRDERISVVTSPHIVAKVIAIWDRPYFAAFMTAELRRRAMVLMASKATWVTPDESVSGVCDDWEDDLLLGTAVEGGAQYIVTGDRGFRRIERYGSVKILTAQERLDIVDL